jgi:hypothetical protein
MLTPNNIKDVDVWSFSGIQTTLQITLKMEKKSWSIELQSLWTYAECCSSADTRYISPTPAWLRDLFHHTKRVCFTNSKRTVLSKHWCLPKPMQTDEEVGYEYHRINYCKACTCSQHWVMIHLQPEPIEKLVSEKYNKDNYNETDITGVGWRYTVGVDMLVLFHQGIWCLHP